MDYTYDFGANIKEARKSKKYTQTRLANAIGVTYAAISKYENGAIIPSLEVMCNIASALDVSMDKLCGFENSSKLSMYALDSSQTQILHDLADLFREQNTRIASQLTDEQYKMIGRIVASFLNR